MSTVVLIGCGAQKLERRAPARELYTGALFRKSLAYAERVNPGGRIFILSALHGLTPLELEILPYDFTLRTALVARAWAKLVAAELEREHRKHWIDRLVVLAGATYADPLERELEARPWRERETVPGGRYWAFREFPLRGMMIGRRLAWLNRQAAA